MNVGVVLFFGYVYVEGDVGFLVCGDEVCVVVVGGDVG